MTQTPDGAIGGLIRPSDAEFKPLRLAHPDPDAPSEACVWYGHISEDRREAFGICRFSRGRFWFIAPDETLIVRAGRIRITVDGGEPLEPQVGEAVYFPEGARVEYEILEDFEEWFWMTQQEPWDFEYLTSEA